MCSLNIRVKPRTDAERKAVVEAMDELRDEWGFSPSFEANDFLNRWMTFVQEVENGYQLSLADYTQELELRDSIETFKGKMPDRLRMEIQDILVPYEERFRFATRETHKPLLPTSESPGAFWWWRLPTVLAGELLHEARLEDLV